MLLQVTQGDLLSTNLFAYCSNNPVMYSDPSGKFKFKISSKLIDSANLIFDIIGIILSYACMPSFGWIKVIASIVLGVYTFSLAYSKYKKTGNSIWVGIGLIGGAISIITGIIGIRYWKFIEEPPVISACNYLTAYLGIQLSTFALISDLNSILS